MDQDRKIKHYDKLTGEQVVHTSNSKGTETSGLTKNWECYETPDLVSYINMVERCDQNGSNIGG
jgi:hypothetical protein